MNFNDLKKKDDNAELLNQDYLGNMIVCTELEHVGTEIKDEEEEEEERERPMSVALQVIRYLFMVVGAIFFTFGIFGIIPFFFIRSRLVSGTLTICAGVMALILSLLMYIFKKETQIAVSLLAVYLLCVFTFIFSVGALFRTIIPLQGCMILFLQCLSVLVYCLYSVKTMNMWSTAIIMGVTGFLVWAIGFVTFIEQQAWIGSGVLFFFCVIGFTAYSVYYIKQAETRFHLKELTRVIVGFFIEPYEWIFVRRATNNNHLDEPFVLVESTNTAHKTVSNEASTLENATPNT